MNKAFDQAYEAYVTRKQAERQAHLLRLRQELLDTLPAAPLGASGRVVAGTARQRHAVR